MYNAVHPQEAPQQMPQIRAMGSVASPILLPISATGPVPLSLTLASDNLSPNASSAFSMIPISMDVEEGAPQPEFRDIQPWDLKHPVAVYANRDGKQLPVFYDAATQEYYLFTIEGAVLLHKTPTITIKKRQARQVLGRISYSQIRRITETELAESIMKGIDLPLSSSPLVDSVSLLRNAMHDSIIVTRNSRPTTFFRFWEDKDVRDSGTLGSDSLLMYLRPSMDGLVGHRCDALWHCGNNVIYCSKCTSYRLPSTCPTSGDADKADNTLTFGPPIPVGRVTVGVHITRKIFDGCLRPDKKGLNIPHAYQTLSKIFHKPTIDSIPIPQTYMVSNLLKDSLFVVADMFPKTAAESWADYFDVGGEHAQQGMSGMTNAAVGVTAGSAIIGTGAMVGLRIAEVVGV
ncbi:predicted protein [Aspergillus nidulans FGSC A4]|uniref:Uncharacterized protein n=1 Tax=Emericella nidulans (strain FGSC A4 / ATCC 38163 / CBS 112.46 / NRRL 194 / M139) TaxID=227321 RepID=Q5AWQ9_EMENI|nr:hypothetical protein [Aspergillus nidulans FGSC A4]EAA61142.1 predicted protein [Aspergillus nidulans FGSC A4]CBF78728.1 TPA: conserved hypothetical protein [Aspergillus nidulans FGSC A4]|eukprot:XP_680540.1 predicted protein [Aspergillus nidulans FGSC A4]